MMPPARMVVLCATLVGCVLLLHTTLVSADDHTHTYADGEGVVLWANKVGPYHNPSETYPYFSVPGCTPRQDRPLQSKADSLGVLLEGDTLQDTGISFPFKQDALEQKICDFTIDEDTADQLNFVVSQHYWYHLLIDELPAFGMVGEYIGEEEMRAELAAVAAAAGEAAPPASAVQAQGFVYTHKDFSISFNGNQIIEVNLTSENPRPIEPGATYAFTYSVTWHQTDLPFESRFDRYLDFDFFEHSIHWFSILNSFMLVVFLCGLVLLILSRTIKTALGVGGGAGASGEKYLDPETGATLHRSGPSGAASPRGSADADMGDETGWKLLVGDVFRAPVNLTLYAVLLGTGVQLLLLLLGVLTLAVVATYYDDRGMLAGVFLLLYSLTSCVLGYVSGSWYKQHGGLRWKRTLLATAAFYPACILGTLCVLNCVAAWQGSNPVLTLPTAALITLVWACVSVPLTILGTMWGRARTQAGVFPCRVNAIRRMIPSEAGAGAGHVSSSLYSNWYLLIAMSGLLPFGSIFIEMYFVFTSFWNYKFYYVYGFIFLIFVILLIVSMCVSIVSTYILLNAEDYRWHWAAFLAAASSTGYILIYSMYYYHYKTHMEGLVQTAFYFAYVGLALLTLGLVTGSVGALATRSFVTKIYSYSKAD